MYSDILPTTEIFEKIRKHYGSIDRRQGEKKYIYFVKICVKSRYFAKKILLFRETFLVISRKRISLFRENILIFRENTLLFCEKHLVISRKISHIAKNILLFHEKYVTVLLLLREYGSIEAS